MTSRRSRIKGIANIPQRRKPVNQKNELESKQVEPYENEDGNNLISKESEVNNTNKNSIDPCKDSNLSSKSLVDNVCQNDAISNVAEIINETSENVVNKNPSEHHETLKTAVELSVLAQTSGNNDSDLNIKKSEVQLEKPNIKAKSFLKKHFVKIPTSLNSSQRKKAQFSQEEKKQSISCPVVDNDDQHSKKININLHNELEQDQIQKNECTQDVQVSEDEVCVPNVAENSSESRENIFQKPLSVTNNAAQSDTEYNLPPPSPNKVNRARIKAIPRLANRKASFSASESEDENRKIDRIRNDSVCSVTSVVTESITECLSPQRKKDTTATILPKRCGRSEQTRKLAEARREFIRRFGANKPERNRLTMMDLIFYNPDSNPMTISEKDAAAAVEDDPEPLKNVDDPGLADNVDNSSPTEDLAKSDEENAMPVPQIKIGPSGEIILDEQSLVIERKDLQRQRAEMENTKIVDADKFKTGYGIYTRHRRSKFWSHFETLRFYKALNTIGTDFMLMCELFPNRVRRELKIKFKKEEKLNRQLVDKALMQPCHFDFEDLKNEMEMEEMELEELRRQNEEQRKQRDEKDQKKQEKIIEKARKRKVEEISKKPTPPIEHEIITKEPEKVIHKIKPKKPKKEKLSIKSFMSDSDADESDLATQSESDEDVFLSRKPTRSGRLPKVVQRYEDESSINYVMRKNKIPNHAQPDNVEPGSIMIITENGPNGEPIYKIYMVTPEQKATRLELSSDAIAKAIQLKEGMSAESIMTISANITDDEEECPQENNITIPADENVTTLKSDVNINIPEEVCSENIEQFPNMDLMSDLSTPEMLNSPMLIATEEDNHRKEGLMVINDFNEMSQIVLEVTSDGTCFKLNDEEVAKNEENSVLDPEDEIIVNEKIVEMDCDS